MILAFDGAATDLSAALAEPDGSPIADIAWTSGHRQSAELLPRLLALLADSGRGLHDTTAIGVGIGPGSFTGLRVALALAKGLAVGLDVPLVGVPSLRAWVEADDTADAAVARAGAREAYVAIRADDNVAIADREALTALGPVIAAAEVAAAFGLEDVRAPRGAVAIASSTAARLEGGLPGDDPRTLEPIYLRAPRGVATESREAVKWL
ncbi:MAG: tRNA (adenosine(37)-N6)-threonylcarbamoyltransferase complex dimerization subunit type 1 TsaB [Chloroflexi bacterium]|nr:tRNA (adenosine(37)-N6)-threonylcarbamoyltransferase complex dimerization subunit type 1 TsaB [Chloroflexota bacterium]